MDTITMQLATEEDLLIISQLAHDIWNIWYTSIIGKEQVTYMLERFYTLTALTEQYKEQDFYIIYQETKPIGYVAVSNKKNDNFFIEKFYIHPKKHTKGIGSFLMKRIIEIYRPKTLRLHVNRKNFIPINFYFKQGFKIESAEDFYIGNDYYMNDFVMRKDL